MSDAETPSAPAAPPEDPFLRDIGDIFDHDLAHLLNPFLVPDVCAWRWEDVRVILLLESPNTNEVRRGYPLAGDSGVAVTQLISENIEGLENLSGPVGDIVNDGRCSLPWLGIVNVCNLPLQDAAYQEKPEDAEILMQHPSWCVFMESLQRIKDTPFRIHRSDVTQRLLEHAIAKDLRRRLCEIRNFNSKSLLCCGGVALAFYAKSQTVCLYHPSSNLWKDEIREAAAQFFRDNATREDSERADPNSES